MRETTPISIDILNSFAAVDEQAVNEMLAGQLKGLNKKIVVLDDDPTGVQTVHHISVYTDWQPETMVAAFEEPNSMFFILTNSRAMSREVTRKAHGLHYM